MYLKYTRLIAIYDNKYDVSNPNWQLSRWTIKFKECTDKDNDGLFYLIYSDLDQNTYISKKECLIDPLSNKYLYTHHCEEDSVGDKSKYILLKKMGVIDLSVSCFNQFSSKTIGKISFGNDGRVYTSSSRNRYVSNIVEMTSACSIMLYDIYSNTRTILIEPRTGYIHQI